MIGPASVFTTDAINDNSQSASAAARNVTELILVA
jgi:hypothetical protein